MLEELKDDIYNILLYSMISATTFMAGYISKNYFLKEEYFFSLIWFMLTIAAAFQKRLWTKFFELKDSIGA